MRQLNLTSLPQWQFGGAAEGLRDHGKLPDVAEWSGRIPPPFIGQRVVDRNFGPGVVVGYLVDDGWLGIHFRADERPDWHREQDPTGDVVWSFGCELVPEWSTGGRRLGLVK